MVSYTVSLVFLTVLMAVIGHFDGPMFGRLVSEPFWVWLNGFIGVTSLTINTLVISRLGGVQAVILPVVGQIVGGLAIDSLGLMRTTVVPMTWIRALGGVLVIVGVACASIKSSGGGKSEDGAIKQTLWYVMALISGFLSAAMTGIYRYMGSVLGSPFRATFVTTVVGCVILGIVSLIPMVNRPFLKDVDKSDRPWWIWFGGIFGSVSASINVWLSQRLGVGLTLVFGLIGNTIGGILVDHFGLFGVAKHKVTPRKIIGVIVMIIGAALIRLM